MKILFLILPFFLCLSLLIPTAFAEEVPPENSLLIYTPDESEEISSDDSTPPDSSESVPPETEASEHSQPESPPSEPEQPSFESQDSTIVALLVSVAVFRAFASLFWVIRDLLPFV